MCVLRLLLVLLLLLHYKLPALWAIGGHGYSLRHGASIAQSHNYMSKYGIPMNLSQEMLDELDGSGRRQRKQRNVLNWEDEIMDEEEEEEEKRLQRRKGRSAARSIVVAHNSSNRNCTDEHWILERLLDGYDKFRIPGGGNVRVEVEIWVQEVSKIIEITSEFELDIYVTEWWMDKRLAFGHLNPCKQNMSVDGAKVLPKIWNPLGCFVNSKDAAVHRSPFSNIFLQLYENGSVWHNYRIKLTGPCVNTFNRFPIDQQRCMLFYESFNHNYEQVQMEWTVTPIVLLKSNITLPDYVLVDFKASSVKRLYPPGIWNELVATFTFKRLYGFYILQVYIPTYISVCMSWISFYLGKDNIQSRTLIGVNSLLSLTYQFGSVVSNLPKTSDIKAIDVMILVAMGFIFSSLIELAVVGYLVSRKMPAAGKPPRPLCGGRCVIFCCQCPGLTANRIDKISLFIFPFCFIVFNLWYWFLFMGRLR